MIFYFLQGLILYFTLTQYVSCEQLKFVQELFRHGARAPISKYWDYEEQIENRGELTPAGYRQLFNLGNVLREEYIKDVKFLSSTYTIKEIYVRSTDVNRTIMSAQAQLLGLYPNGFQLPENLETQYIIPPYKNVKDVESLKSNSLPYNTMVFPVHTVDEKNDIELQPWKHCEDYLNQVKQFQVQNSEIIIAFNERHNSFYRKLSNLLDQEINHFYQIGGAYGGVYDVFIADVHQKRKLPEGFTEEDMNMLKYIDSFSWFFVDVGTDIGVKQLVTPFLNMLIQNFDNKIQKSTPDYKWMMYSAHDSNLILAMRAFNISNYQCLMDLWEHKATTALNCHFKPEFASSMILELYEKDDLNTHYVRIKYNGEYVKLCERDEIECEYVEFKNRILDYVLPDFQESCKGQPNTLNNFKQNINSKQFKQGKSNNQFCESQCQSQI